MEFNQFKKRIGLKIKYYRNLRDLTQEVLSEKIDCSVNYLSLVENGHKNISLNMIYRISKALDVNVSKIFDVED